MQIFKVKKDDWFDLQILKLRYQLLHIKNIGRILLECQLINKID